MSTIYQLKDHDTQEDLGLVRIVVLNNDYQTSKKELIEGFDDFNRLEETDEDIRDVDAFEKWFNENYVTQIERCFIEELEEEDEEKEESDTIPYNSDSLILAVDSHYGIYVPQTFIERYENNLSPEDREKHKVSIECLRKGPDEEWYWEAWEVIEGLEITVDWLGEKKNGKYNIMMSDDVWLIPFNMEWPEEN